MTRYGKPVHNSIILYIPIMTVPRKRCILYKNFEEDKYFCVVYSCFVTTCSCLRGWLFTPWTMKSSQGHVKFVIGSWIRPGITLAHTKAERCYFNDFFWKRGDEDKRRQENGETLFIYCSKFPFWGIYFKKINTFTFWCMVIPLGPTFSLHLVRSPKAL